MKLTNVLLYARKHFWLLAEVLGTGIPTVLIFALLVLGELTPEQTQQATLVVLGLLVAATLVERLSSLSRIEAQAADALRVTAEISNHARTLPAIENDLHSLLSIESGHVSTDHLFTTLLQLPRVQDRSEWQHMQTFWACGISLSQFAASYKHMFKETGSTQQIRLIIADPATLGLREEFLLPGAKRSVPAERRILQVAMENLLELPERLGNGKVEIRLLSYVPPFTLMLIDPETPRGVIQVTLNLFDKDLPERPIFHLRADRDKKWYSVFLEQFKRLWDREGAVELSRETAASFLYDSADTTGAQ